MKQTRPNCQIIDEASAWFVDFRVGDIDNKAREEFDVWLRRSPEHIQAYLEIAGTYAELPAPPVGQFDLETLIAHARSSDNVVDFRSQQSGDRNRGNPSFKLITDHSSLITRLVASVLLMIVAATTWLYMQRGIYSTAIGEQRSIALADGSTIDLNARTKIRVTLDDTQRHIELIEGQALFQVAHDIDRPFTVQSDGTTVRAVGTQFDVYRKRSGTVVTVVEGTVAVTSPSPVVGDGAGDGPAVPQQKVSGTVLTAGEQLTVTPTATSKPTHADLQVATAWTQRRLVFDNTSLTDVADEFNRYNTRRLILDDDCQASSPSTQHSALTTACKMHISGTYFSTNPESLLRFLRAQSGLKVTETDHEIRITSE
jgi:ferric-dicitrate binding protein FerR (iron transport regulator)